MPVCILQDRKNANRTLSLESSALVQRVGDLRTLRHFSQIENRTEHQ
jgi:hypothetical protein